MKRVWITAPTRDEEGARRLTAAARAYGLDAGGHFWEDDLERMAWAGALAELEHPDTGAWAILAPPAAWGLPTVRRGLALLALAVQARRGLGFPILLVGAPEGEAPTPLAGAARLALEDPSLPAKLVAAVHRPASGPAAPYRLVPHPTPGLGLWMEVGPGPGETWRGALFGVAGGTLDAHGAGPAGRLPERSVLEYPMKGISLELDGTAYQAWAVRNVLGPGESYYLRVRDLAGPVLFGPFPEDDAAELRRVRMD